jgi:hypothetical protein
MSVTLIQQLTLAVRSIREMVVIDSEKPAWRRGQTENVSREKLSFPHQDAMWGTQNMW